MNTDKTLTYRLNIAGENGETYRDHVKSKRFSIAPVLQWTPSDYTKLTFEADILRNRHPLDRGFTRYPNQQTTYFDSKEYWWESGKQRNLLYNNNDMLQLRLEHQLNDDWTLNVGGQYLNGELYGYAVEASGLKANTDGQVIKRNYNWRRLDWIDKIFRQMYKENLIYLTCSIRWSLALRLNSTTINLISSVHRAIILILILQIQFMAHRCLL